MSPKTSHPTDPPEPAPTAPPARLKTARVLLWVQTAFALLATVVLVVGVAERLDHGQDAGLLTVIAAINAAMALGLLLGTANVMTRRPWVRPLLFSLETVYLINALVNIATVSVTGVLGLLLAVAIITTLLDRRVKDWAEQR